MVYIINDKSVHNCGLPRSSKSSNFEQFVALCLIDFSQGLRLLKAKMQYTLNII